MVKSNSFLGIVIILFAFVFSMIFSSAAVVNLINLQGNVQNSGVNVDEGNITVEIYDAATAGNLLYNSSREFYWNISDGKYDITLGSNASNPLALNYGDFYYMAITINNEALTFSGLSRQKFQSSVGNISSGDVDIIISQWLYNQSDGSYNATYSQWAYNMSDGSYNASYAVGSYNATYIAINNSVNILTVIGGIFNSTYHALKALPFQVASNLIYNDTAGVRWGIGTATPDSTLGISGNASISTNLSVGDEIFINGVEISQWLYNMSDGSYNASYDVGSYNATYALWAYNMTDGSYNATYASINSSANILTVIGGIYNASYAKLAGGNAFTGVQTFDGGWASGGVTITGNTVFAGNIYAYNISSLEVSNLNVNGSVIPSFDNMFNIGSPDKKYMNLFLVNDTFINGASVGKWLYNQTTNSIYYYNMTDGSYNATYATWAYNMSDGSYNASYAVGSYNATYATINTSANILTVIGGIYNTTYDSTYNVTYADKKSSPFQTSATTIYNNTMNTFVGIGTATPYYQLEIYNTTGATLMIHSNRETAGDVATIRLGLGNTAPTAYQKGAIFFQADGSGNARGDMIFAVDSVADSGNALVTDAVMTLKNGGNVGIGTLAPDSMLTINGTGYLLNVSNGATSALFINGTGNVGIGTQAPTSKVDVRGNLNVSNGINVTSGGLNVLGGNVGIGTSTPGSTLDVVGNTNITGNITMPRMTPATAGLTTVGSHELSMWASRWSGSAPTNAPMYLRVNYLDSAATGLGMQILDAGRNPLVIIKNNGRVGIGTTVPNQNLTVVGTVNMTGGGPTTSGLIIDSSGNVGIGTASPDSPLEVDFGSTPNYIYLDTTGGNLFWGLKLRGSSETEVAEYMANGTSGEIRIGSLHANYYPTFYSGNAERMRITTGGKVGINTSTPNADLDIKGIVSINGTGSALPFYVEAYAYSISKFKSLHNQQVLAIDAGNSTVKAYSTLSFQDNAVQQFAIFKDTGNNLRISNSSGTMRFVIQQTTGNVGINTLSPNQKLTVVGTVNMTGGGATVTGLNIDSSGNVGIGTTTPTQLLDVAGNFNMSQSGANISLGGGLIYWDSVNSRMVIKVS
ncbi:hypothetical protein J4463_02140 [Candidatus Pacearchaeota archaeon]|nr:hypothetical protein [Candidatus Pacearchaeota archaeon]